MREGNARAPARIRGGRRIRGHPPAMPPPVRTPAARKEESEEKSISYILYKERTNMMKAMKKLFVFALALTLIFTAGVTVRADDTVKNDSITINNAKPGETYTIYKLFDLSVNNEIEPTAYTYTISAGWEDFFAEAGDGTEAGPGRQYVTINDAGEVTAISDAEALAKAAAEWSGKPAAADSVTVAEGETTASFTELPDGYWVITSTLGTIAMADTTPDQSAVTVNEKNPEDTVEKEVLEDGAGESGTYSDSNDAQIGDTIYFQSTVKIVKGTRNVVVHDKMDSGLSYTADSVAIEGLTKGTEYTVNESPSDGDTFDITFTQSWIDDLDFGDDGYLEYVITYNAVLNENAVVKDENGVAVVDQKNKTHVTYGDNTSSAEDETTTTTHEFSVYKHAADETDNLGGAVFKLKKGSGSTVEVIKLIKLDDNNYRVANGEEQGAQETFTTVDDGDIVIWGVDADDDYSLEEVSPPSGYNKLTSDVEVTVNADNSTRIDVENKAGSELPGTGGIGTVIFTVLGAILLIGAVVLLVCRRRADTK